MPDLLIRGGDVVDGTGAVARRADIVVRDGRIAAVIDGGVVEDPAATVIDATGLVVAPGFVDIHTHSDLTLLSAPTAPSTVRQGVTTAVVGNCGLGVFPVPADPAERDRLRAAVAYLDLDPAVAWTWRDFGGYADALATATPSIGVGVLAAHLPLHAAVVGYDDRPASAAELDTMCGLLGDSLAAGALGLSTGLAYAPLTTVDEAELVALGRVVAAHDGLFAWHVRDYEDGLLESAAQLLRVAATTGCRVQLSHLQAVGRRNWDLVPKVLDRVDAALADGVDVGVDMYPYLAGNCPLSQLLPAWAQAGGVAAMVQAVSEVDSRARIRDQWVDRPIGWDEVTVSRLPVGAAERPGSSIADLAAATGRHGDETALDLLAAYGNDVMITAYGRTDANVRAVFRHPAAVVASDGQALDPEGPTGAGAPHPRAYGCFARLLQDYTGPGGLTLPEAVRKATSAPAARVGLTDRGTVAAGMRADLVVLDPDGVTDRAGYTDPQRHPAGMPVVVVGGVPVVHDGQHTGATPGTIAGPRFRSGGGAPLRERD